MNWLVRWWQTRTQDVFDHMQLELDALTKQRDNGSRFINTVHKNTQKNYFEAMQKAEEDARKAQQERCDLNEMDREFGLGEVSAYKKTLENMARTGEELGITFRSIADDDDRGL